MLAAAGSQTDRLFLSQPLAGYQHGLKHTILVTGNSEKGTRSIAEELCYAYRVITERLRQAHSAVSESKPDIIVVDYTTSRTEILQLCYQLKLDAATKHIPVILVGDQVDFQGRLIGLQYGANDCITGPTYPEELIWRIRNLIQLCCNIQNCNSSRLTVSGPSRADAPPDRSRLLVRILDVMEKNIANPNFCVRTFSREAGLSQIQLYRRLIEFKGYPPNEYIRVYRLQRAAELLLEEAGNIGEVAYRVGFSNLSYFSKCFRRMHGCSPGEFVRKVKRGNGLDLISQAIAV